MAFIKLDENNVVIVKVLHNDDGNYEEVSDNVVCGQIKQEDGTFVNPLPPELPYDMKRQKAYSALNQFEMQFDDQQNNTTTWVDAINDIKARFPK
jgi:hypothetical protein